jgi:hypothetical protein
MSNQNGGYRHHGGMALGFGMAKAAAGTTICRGKFEGEPTTSARKLPRGFDAVDGPRLLNSLGCFEMGKANEVGWSGQAPSGYIY